MRESINRLRIVQERVQGKVNDRGNTFLDRSESWQKSDNGKKHMEKVELLKVIKDDIEDVIFKFEQYLDETDG